MNYLYIDFPKYKNGGRNLSSIRKNDTLEVRLCELEKDSTAVLFRELEKLNLKIDLKRQMMRMALFRYLVSRKLSDNVLRLVSSLWRLKTDNYRYKTD